METESHSNAQKQAKKKWPLLKVLVSFVVIVIVFDLGVSVGKGTLSWHHFSPLGNNSKLPNQLDYSSVNELYAVLKKDYDGNLDQTKLIDGLKTGLVNSAADPYTEYFNPTDAKSFNDQLSGTITGIGAELGTNTNNQIVIVSPLSGYPAEKAGLKPQDVITAINGQSTDGMSVDAAVLKIRGNVGTQVKLTIVRDGASPFDLTITRQKITIPSVQYHEDGDIGYLKISQFSDDTVALAQKAATEFKAKDVKGVVLDLRGDPGGYLSGAVNVSSLWLDPGKTVVSERRGSTIIDTEKATGDNPLKGLPTVVLIDGGSASASEITAGALHDNGVATLVGVKSFGKGSVQQVESFPDGSELKVTIARWYTPDGKNIDKQGITPDTVVDNPDAAVKAGQDPQKDKAYQVLQQKIQG